jgi:D-aminopeptidase
MLKSGRALLPALVFPLLLTANAAQPKPRARELGVPFDGTPGPFNAITDVEGVQVGYTTLISGEGRLKVGAGPVRTGVSVVLPRGRTSQIRSSAVGSR